MPNDIATGAWCNGAKAPCSPVCSNPSAKAAPPLRKGYAFGATNGNSTKKVLPLLGSDSNQMRPLYISIRFLDIANPNPVPEVLVVKLGVNIFDFTSSGMPLA
jgi:hypothetical protein